VIEKFSNENGFPVRSKLCEAGFTLETLVRNVRRFCQKFLRDKKVENSVMQDLFYRPWFKMLFCEAGFV